eukprot:6017674-Prymnesium_polylepis.1
MAAAAAAAAGGSQLTTLLAHVVRVELYSDPDAAASRAHAEPSEPLSGQLEVGGLYFQQYAGGYGWGVSVRMPGDGRML